jgi:endoglucanase
MLFAVDTGGAQQAANQQFAAALSSGDTKLGVYDPAAAFSATPGLAIEHVYLPLVGVDLESLREAGSYAASRNRDLLITVEPWSWDGRWNIANEEAIAQLVAGEFDKQIVSLCRATATLPTPVIIRWGHEMDAKTQRYAWTLLPPEDYIAGYRHFVSLCRQQALQARFMWSPLGEPDLGDYYPGDDVVDVIGFSVFALQQYELDMHKKARNVGDIARERYDLVIDYKKPVYIAELGCEGDTAYVEECIQQFRSLGETLPELAAIVYFNDVEPAAWPLDYGKPDWRLPNSAFD